ncbi:hypothetical protein [Phenylobacterium sp.]|uniref:hypothetical protein n=1 Tax=Phenylobacterium sp. TaxID=1871053 RepID=UPI0025E19E70|nr:hypothetical protein [Phenylobacterium sp.]
MLPPPVLLDTSTPDYTPADFSAFDYLHGSEYEYTHGFKQLVLIEIRIKAKGFSFQSGDNPVVTNSQYHGEMFCVKKAFNVGKNETTVQFYVETIDPDVNGDPYIGSYFLRLNKNGSPVNYLLDPNVKNTG